MDIPAQNAVAGRRGPALRGGGASLNSLLASARSACRILAATMVCWLVLAGAARADAPQNLLRAATATVQRTVAHADAIPARAAAALPAPAAVGPVVPAVVQDVGARTAAVAAGASATVEQAGADVGAVVQTLPQHGPVSRVLAPVTHALEPSGSSKEAARPAPAQTAPPAGRSPAERSEPASGSAARTVVAAADPAGATAVAPDRARAGISKAVHATRSVSMSARGRTGRADAAPEPRTLALSSDTGLFASAAAYTGATGGQSAVRPSHGGAQPPAPVPGQGGAGAAQAVAGSGGSVGLAMVLVLVLLAWLASFARRLRPPGDAVRDVRLLLILERPG